ncbi:hypothetical protein ACFVTE_14685 [Arthrobacter sp. NPDC058097]|uniref:hypothetical protein n=1 Tax=Arthrobacter sp. NPDC058097 TaxID=3346340 RepID=UPI0036DEE9DF
MNDFVPRPHEPYDAHWVIKHDLANIIAKYTTGAITKQPPSTSRHLPASATTESASDGLDQRVWASGRRPPTQGPEFLCR